MCAYRINCVVKKLTVHAPCITSIRGRTDSKFESLLHIIETKCVSEFDMLCHCTFGEESSIGNDTVLLCSEEINGTHTL